MLWTNLLRAVLLGLVPLAALAGVLRVEQHYAVAFVAGGLSVLFSLAYSAFIPALVGRERLIEGNSRLEMTNSIAQVAGPSVAGALVQILTAPVAVAADALSYLVAGLLAWRIRVDEPTPGAGRRLADVPGEVAEGLRLTLHQPLLRAFALSSCVFNGTYQAVFALYALYLTRDLGIAPVTYGLILAAAGPAAVVGAVLSGLAARRVGLGRTVLLAQLGCASHCLLVPLAGLVPPLAVPLLAASQALFAFANPIYNVNVGSLRQAVTPDEMLGRTGASLQTVTMAAAPVGAAIGGLLGERLGVPTAIAVCAVAMLGAFPWIALSPLPRLAELPREVVAAAG
jgi:predicted MFS family arabinose efflux permease